ncbi:MAG: tetratricopeptide repeat protein [Thermodesulfobacteriota bacterium]
MSSRYWKILACLLLVLATCAAYEGVRNHQFLNFDDDLYVTNNPQVKTGLTLKSLIYAFTTTDTGNWIPLTWLSHMAACQVFGLYSGGHHLINLFFHVANTLLLFLFCLRTTKAPGPSFLVAALFALHPLHVESVAWVAERKDVLSTFFWLLSMWAYIWYVESPGRGRYLAVLVCFILGLMSKSMLVTLPFVLLLLDFWPLGRWSPYGTTAARPKLSQSGSLAVHAVPLRRLILEKAPLLVLSALICLITLHAQKESGSVQNITDLPLASRLANAAVAYLTYITKMVWPSGLAPLYPHPEQDLPLWQVLVAGVVLVSISLFIIRQGRRRPYLLMGWLWYLGTLVPVIGLVQVGGQALADRYTYVPLIGLFIIAAWGLRDLTTGGRGARVLVPLTAGMLLSVLALCTWFQVRLWRDGLTLYEYTLRVTQGNYLIQNNLGVVLNSQGKRDQAISHYYEALRIKPNYHKAHFNLGNALGAKGQKDQAIFHYKEALRLQPDYAAEAHYNLANTLAANGQTDQAMEHYRQVLRLQPHNADAHNNLGLALSSQGKTEEARFHYAEAIRMQPDHAKAHYNLANILVAQGKVEEAIFHYQEALRLLPAFGEAHNNLGNALLSQGKVDQALVHFSEFARLRPDDAKAYFNMGRSLAIQGKMNQAMMQYKEAIRLKPDYPQALNNLAWILATTSDRNLRDGPAAVSLAEQANQFTGYGQPGMLDTLAAAYAEAGRFSEAIQASRKAVELARRAGDTELLKQLEATMRSLQAGRLNSKESLIPKRSVNPSRTPKVVVHEPLARP